jgi:hypothetical protein
MLGIHVMQELTPNQLQEGNSYFTFLSQMTLVSSKFSYVRFPTLHLTALSKTFSTKKRKGKLQKAWAGTQVIYNVASWSATAIG